MANFSTITAALFCFFTLSLALTPLSTPENDDVAAAVALAFPDTNPTVSSNPSEPVNAEDNHLSLPTSVVPLNKISFNPFYRRFSKSPCHHRHKFHKADPMKPLEIPYGNDMLVSSGENSDFQNPETPHGGSSGENSNFQNPETLLQNPETLHGGSSGENSDFQNPETLRGGSWQRVKHQHHHHHHHHHDDSDSDSDSDSDDEGEDDRIKKMALKRPHFGGFDAEKKLKRHFHHENTEEEEYHHHHKKERSGFMIRVRKFFDHYF